MEGFAKLIVETEPTVLLNPYKVMQANDQAKMWFLKSKDGSDDKQIVVELYDHEAKEFKRINVMRRPYPHRVFILFATDCYLNYNQVKGLLDKLKEADASS